MKSFAPFNEQDARLRNYLLHLFAYSAFLPQEHPNPKERWARPHRETRHRRDATCHLPYGTVEGKNVPEFRRRLRRQEKAHVKGDFGEVLRLSPRRVPPRRLPHLGSQGRK